MGTPARKPGRRPQLAVPGKKVSLGLKVTADIKNKLDAAAKTSGNTQSQEAEARISASFAPPHPLVPPEHVVPALLLLSHYLRGAPSVVHWLLDQPGTDEEQWLRWQAMESEMHSWRAQHIELFEIFARKLEEQK